MFCVCSPHLKLCEDTNCDIYPIKEGDRLTFVLASTLDLSGKPDDGTYKPLGDEVQTHIYNIYIVYTPAPLHTPTFALFRFSLSASARREALYIYEVCAVYAARSRSDSNTHDTNWIE